MTTNYNSRLKLILVLELVLSAAPPEPIVQEKANQNPNHEVVLINFIHLIRIKHIENSPGNMHTFIYHLFIIFQI